jgi:hypothetical protein
MTEVESKRLSILETIISLENSLQTVSLRGFSGASGWHSPVR